MVHDGINSRILCSLHTGTGTWPNTYLDDTRGKIVIYSWSMVARRQKSGKRCIFLDAEE